jgi:hypothetical protein
MVLPVLTWLRRAGSLLYRLAYGKPIYEEIWTFAPGSLRIAREAIGMDLVQVEDLVGLARPGAGWGHILEWIGLDGSKETIRCTSERLAVLISTGMAVNAKAAGSNRGIAELILFGPAPLSHYPPITSVRPDHLDAHDFRRIIEAYLLLLTAAERLDYHDTTMTLRHRLDQAIAELDSWVAT